MRIFFYSYILLFFLRKSGGTLISPAIFSFSPSPFPLFENTESLLVNFVLPLDDSHVIGL